MEINLTFRSDGTQGEAEVLAKILRLVGAELPQDTTCTVETITPDPIGVGTSKNPDEGKESTQGEEEKPAQGEEETPNPVKEISDEELRRLMDMSISKFAGNGWKESKDPRALAIRKECTKVFKEIAKYYGAEKPTQLEGEARGKFADQLENIFIEEKEGGYPTVSWEPF